MPDPHAPRLSGAPPPRMFATRICQGLALLAAVAPIGRYLLWGNQPVRFNEAPLMVVQLLTIITGLVLLLRAGLVATFSRSRPLPALRVGLAVGMILLGALGLFLTFAFFAHWD